MIPTVYIGIDPGVCGAYAIYWPDEPAALIADDLPVAGGELDLTTFVRKIAGYLAPDDKPLGVVERVHSMPKQGVSSTFKFGAAYGSLRGVLAGLCIPTTLVTPGVWKKHHGLPADKEAARAFALRLFPGTDLFSRKKDHGRAEATLIALYAAHRMYGFGKDAA